MSTLISEPVAWTPSTRTEMSDSANKAPAIGTGDSSSGSSKCRITLNWELPTSTTVRCCHFGGVTSCTVSIRNLSKDCTGSSSLKPTRLRPATDDFA